MISHVVPVNLFQSVSEFGREPNPERLPTQPFLAEQKKLSHYQCTHHIGPEQPGSVSFDQLFQKISLLITESDERELSRVLSRKDVFKAIESFQADEKVSLVQLLFKHVSYQMARTAFDTRTGYYLTLQPTSDQFVVATICSLLETSDCDKSLKYLDRRVVSIDQWIYAQDLRLAEACHTPQYFANLTSVVQPEIAAHDFFSHAAGKATRNIAKPCRNCLVYTTDEKAHAEIFHPDGLTPVARDEIYNRCVYSDQFLKLLDSSHLSEQEKERLSPPVLFRMFNKVGCNYAALPDSALLLPEVYLSGKLHHDLDEMRNKLIREIKQPFDGESFRVRQAIDKCAKASLSFSRNIPKLAQIGAEIKKSLQQQQVAIPQDTVAQRFLVKRCPTPVPLPHACELLSDNVAGLLAANIATQPTQWYLAGRAGGEDFFPRTAIRGIVRQAMDAACYQSDSDIRPGSSPLFIGQVPEEFAKLVSHVGFLDSNYGGNFLRGKYPNGLALTCLASGAGLRRKVLATILDHGQWGAMFDQNPDNTVDLLRASDGEPFFRLNLRRLLMFNNSPFKLHGLLTTGQISASLGDIATVISLSPEQDKLLARLGKRMKMPEPMTLTRLAQLADDIRVLEIVLATKHLNSMEQVNRAMGNYGEIRDPGVISSYLEDGKPGIGNFPANNHRLSRIKAKKCLANNYRIKGIQLPNGRDRTSVKPLNITTESEIDACHAFIAYPPTVKRGK